MTTTKKSVLTMKCSKSVAGHARKLATRKMSIAPNPARRVASAKRALCASVASVFLIGSARRSVTSTRYIRSAAETAMRCVIPMSPTASVAARKAVSAKMGLFASVGNVSEMTTAKGVTVGMRHTLIVEVGAPSHVQTKTGIAIGASARRAASAGQALSVSTESV